MSQTVGDFVLENEDKVERALHGSVTRLGKQEGGVGDNASDEALLAEYDRLGGLITKDGLKVKTGSFYDFSAKKPREEAQIIFVTNLEGDLVDVTEEEATAIRTAKEKVSELKKKKVQKMTETEVPKKNKKGGKV